jgi:hypothetical protein
MTQPRDRDFITKENDVVIDEVRIDSLAGGGFSIRDYVTSIGFYESIFTSFMIGDMTLVDSVGLMKKLPIIGREIITLTYRSPQNKDFRTIKFRVIGQNNRFRTDQTRADIVSLKLMSVDGYSDLNTRVSRSYSGSISQIVKDIAEEYYTSEVVVDNTSGNFQYAFPFQRPSQMISQMCKKGFVENDISNVGYVFYESVSGLSFKNLVNLYTSEPVNFYFDANVRRTSEVQDDFTLATHKMRNLKFGKMFNRGRQINSGAFSLSLKSFDITRKSIFDREFSYITDSVLSKDKGRGKPIISAIENENFTRSKILYTNDSTSRFGVDYDDITETDLFLNSNIATHDDSDVTFDICGDSNIEVGQTISLQITKNDVDEEIKQEGESDEDLSTTYLIKKVGHRFFFSPEKGDEHTTAIEAVRNFRGIPVPTTTTIGG